MLIYILLLMNLFSNVYAQERGNFCSTPLGDPGACINIKQCPSLLNLLKTQHRNTEVRTYLIRSTCGYDGTIPFVCCPGTSPLENPFAATTTTIAPPPPPRPQDETSSASPRNPVYTDKRLLYDFKDICGVSNISINRVVGGKPAKLREFSWVAAIGYINQNNPNQYKWLCGGSLITDQHILTAAHCVYGRKDISVVRIGDLDLYSDDDDMYAETIPIMSARVHEGYNSSSFVNDIAILKLQHHVDLNKVVPVCLPIDEPLRSANLTRRFAFIAGWGATSYRGISSSSLLKASLEIVSNDGCKAKFDSVGAKTTIDERVLCAGTGGKDSCQGDSGGPLMSGEITNTNRYYQVGLVSYGYKCAEPGFSGVYSRLTTFLDWIENNID